jgi:hypothetical protein
LSIVADREWRALQTLTLRRNWPMLDKTLAACGVAHHIEPHRLPRRDYAEIAAQASGLGRSSAFEKLVAVVNEDRRKTRYVRLRKAIANGLADPDELKRSRPRTEAVDPQLDEVVKRLMRRCR